MKKTIFILMVLTILAKILGFTREIVLSYFYGVSNISDAYLISLTIPMVVFSMIGVSIKTTYIPTYSSIQKEHGTSAAIRFTNNLVNVIFVISSIIIIAVFVFPLPIVKMFALGFEGYTLSLAINFTRISIFSIYFIGVLYVFEGFLQIKKSFIMPALISLPLNIVLIASINLSTNIDIRILAYGQVVAVFAQLLFLVPSLYKEKYRYRFFIDINDKDLRRVTYSALPIMLGVSVDAINKLVDRTIASQVAVGGISALSYASRLNSFVLSIFVLQLIAVLYPSLSKLAVENNIAAFKKSLTDAILGVAVLVIPISIGTMIFSETVVRVLFGRGAFDNDAITLTSSALLFYSVGMIGFGLRDTLSRAFYALQDTRTPIMNATIAMALNIVLNLILSRFLGIGGLALATSISAIFSTILLFISLRKYIGNFGLRKMSITFIKIIFASIVMGIIAKLSFIRLNIMFCEHYSLAIAIFTGAVIYFIILFFMKINEVNEIITFLRRTDKLTSKRRKFGN